MKAYTSYLLLNAKVVNENKIEELDILIELGKIKKIGKDLGHLPADEIIDLKGKYLIPGIIDDQVHFREPGLTHKGTIYTEAKAAVAGGITTYMEMPNTVPNALTQELLAEKYQIASQTSLANYSFFMGTSNDNLEEVLKTDPKTVCGVKIFMGSSTGNMLVDNESTLDKIFANCPLLIATHCEDEHTINENSKKIKALYGDDTAIALHADIRSVDACLKSSSMAVSLAKKYNTRLHVLHISTAEELALFDNSLPLDKKRITAEVCVHHLYFDQNDYQQLGTLIKWNPAVKESRHKKALLQGLLSNKLDIIATDHAPHTLEEKKNNYWKAPSGAPMVQHALQVMLDFYHQKQISLKTIIDKMCHAPAICFQIKERGFIREGYWADLAILDLERETVIQKENILYKCKWSPLEGKKMKGLITHTFVSGHLAYRNGVFDEQIKGERITFER
jgi:dihydroorotase